MKKIAHGFAVACLLAVLQAVPGVASATVQQGWLQAGWFDDFEVAVKQAKSIRRPVLVYFDAVWCSWCQQYKRDVLDRPAVKSFLQSHYVPVVVDFDARPDLFNRFGGVGLPFTVILSAEGSVVNRFVGILAEQSFLDMLRENRKRSVPLSVIVMDDLDVITVNALNREGYQRFRQAFLQHIELLYSVESGTLVGQFETGATLKRASPQTWLYLMKHGLWPDRIEKALASERERLLDKRDGGFFNFLDPAHTDSDYLESSKLLEANAWLTAWYAIASRTIPSATVVADRGWFYLREVLWDKEQGGFWQAQVADNRYYALTDTEKAKRPLPAVDKIKRADANAQAVLALYRAASDSNNAEMKRYAGETLDFIFDGLMKDGRLFHVRDEAGVSVEAFPQDWLWVLIAAQTIEEGEGVWGPEREQKIAVIAQQTSVWLQQQMRKKSLAPLPVELVAVIARSSCDPNSYFQIPKSSCVWALGQLRIEPETPPDSIVSGLVAWELYLANLLK